MSECPAWLRTEVITGLQRLLLLNLRGGPALETIEGVALAWCDACVCWPIEWQAEADAPRLRQAFRSLAASCREWPAPVQLRDALPARTPPPQLPPPASDAERVAEIQAEVRELIRGWSLPAPASPAELKAQIREKLKES